MRIVFKDGALFDFGEIKKGIFKFGGIEHFKSIDAFDKSKVKVRKIVPKNSNKTLK